MPWSSLRVKIDSGKLKHPVISYRLPSICEIPTYFCIFFMVFVTIIFFLIKQNIQYLFILYDVYMSSEFYKLKIPFRVRNWQASAYSEKEACARLYIPYIHIGAISIKKNEAEALHPDTINHIINFLYKTNLINGLQ